MAGPNWAKLKREGRVKDIGEPWNDEESKAVFDKNIPPEYVRKGITTLEGYEKERKKEKIDTTPRGRELREMSYGDLQTEAKKYDIPANQSRDQLIEAIIDYEDKNNVNEEDEEEITKDYHFKDFLTKKKHELVELAEKHDIEIDKEKPRGELLSKLNDILCN